VAAEAERVQAEHQLVAAIQPVSVRFTGYLG